ncbi:hypothetical protein BU15DRAFT_68926 [Melanogaster broomeanus]|nr:hypothetical protein BU15DRAFT_68926 [Melanogaster broomeanus]
MPDYISPPGPLASSAPCLTAKCLTMQPLPAPISPLTPQLKYHSTPAPATPDYLPPLASSAHFPTAKRLTTQPLPAPLSPLTLQPRYQLTLTFAMPDYIPWSLALLSDNEEGLEKENHPASATKREILKHARSLSVEAEEKPKMKKLKAVKAVRSAPLSTEEADGGRWSEDDVTKFIVEIFENRWDEFKHNRNRVLKTYFVDHEEQVAVCASQLEGPIKQTNFPWAIPTWAMPK